jgi:hypothetical protein
MEAVEAQFTPLLLDRGHHEKGADRGDYTGGNNPTIGQLVFELDLDVVRCPHLPDGNFRLYGRERIVRAAMLRIEIEREADGRWIGEVPDLPGVLERDPIRLNRLQIVILGLVPRIHVDGRAKPGHDR